MSEGGRMDLYRVTVTLNPDREPDVDGYEFLVDREDRYWELAGYLDRLQTARIVDSWDGEPASPDISIPLDFLRQQHNEELENIESGYEQRYSDGGGGGSSYRRDMIDAGRGHLVR